MWSTSRISKRVYYQIDHTLSCTIQLYQNNEMSLLIVILIVNTLNWNIDILNEWMCLNMKF